MNIIYHFLPYISPIVSFVYTALPCVNSSQLFFVCLKKKSNNVLDTVLQLEFSVICGIRLFKLCPLLSLRMTCSCISFHVVYLLNLPFRSLFIPISPRGRQRKYSLYNIYNKLPSSFCRFLLCSVFSDLVSGVDILSNS